MAFKEGIFGGWGWEKTMTAAMAITPVMTAIRTIALIISETARSGSGRGFLQIDR
jgi:hypothetical protein